MADTVGLTMGELDRLHVMTRLAERRPTRRKAAALLGLSERQVHRLDRRLTDVARPAWPRAGADTRAISDWLTGRASAR